jgi:2-keto-4-pentenoate hydratase
MVASYDRDQVRTSQAWTNVGYRIERREANVVMSEVYCTERISQELLSLLGTDNQVEPFSRRYPLFDLAAAYHVVTRVSEVRRARGEHPVGRKIGFTNTSIWAGLGISAPIWNYVFDTTVRHVTTGQNRIELKGMPEPRLEPEIVLHLASPPAVGMTHLELFDCIDWIAPAFEVVYSIFPAWDFTAGDAAAAYGVHGALIVGHKLDVTQSRVQFMAELSTFVATLESEHGVRRIGHARNVLGGPLFALKFLVEEIARHPSSEPLKEGEIVATGTLTEAMPAHPGQSWTAQFQGIELTPLRITFSSRASKSDGSDTDEDEPQK